MSPPGVCHHPPLCVPAVPQRAAYLHLHMRWLEAALVDVVEGEGLGGVGAVLVHLDEKPAVLVPPCGHHMGLGERHAQAAGQEGQGLCFQDAGIPPSAPHGPPRATRASPATTATTAARPRARPGNRLRRWSRSGRQLSVWDLLYLMSDEDLQRGRGRGEKKKTQSYSSKTHYKSFQLSSLMNILW